MNFLVSVRKLGRGIDDHLRVTSEMTGYTPIGPPTGKWKGSREHFNVVRTGRECRPARKGRTTLSLRGRSTPRGDKASSF